MLRERVIVVIRIEKSVYYEDEILVLLFKNWFVSLNVFLYVCIILFWLNCIFLNEYICMNWYDLYVWYFIYGIYVVERFDKIF